MDDAETEKVALWRKHGEAFRPPKCTANHLFEPQSDVPATMSSRVRLNEAGPNVETMRVLRAGG